MSKKDLLFYEAYEDFYAMARTSKVFQTYCKEAFGEDFSQDGFSDVAQIDMILPYIPKTGDVHILDIGCGNGKMLAYLQQRTGAYIHGFDYSEEAIRTAKELFLQRAEFREGIIGEIDYPEASFDVVISMDTMYFTKDMTAFVAQVKRWLKPGGVFFVGYQEGDVMPKTADMHTTRLAEALRMNNLHYEATDITDATYELLQKKRLTALKHQRAFLAEDNIHWCDLLMSQTDCAAGSLAKFRKKMARYIYVIRR